MPRYYEDKPDGGACAGVKEDLGACLLQSDCVLQVARPAGAQADADAETGRRGWHWYPGRPAVAVRRRGCEPCSQLNGLPTVAASVPSGVKLEIRPVGFL